MSIQVRYSIIIPMFNEEAVIQETYRRIKKVMGTTGEPYELIFINDGSTDNCAQMIEEYSYWDESVKLIDLSRNFGHQVAITAGMDYALGDAVVIIDADLQDPPELIPEMISEWKQGYQVVYAKRIKRNGESLFKKWSASLFYRVLRYSTDISIPVDTGDFRLMDRRVCDELKRLPEKNRFVRGLVSWVGFRQKAIEYEREERLAGETKYPLGRMLKLSLDGITSFSYKPLKLAGVLGALLSVSGFLYLLYVLYLALFTDAAVKGWASMIGITLTFNGFVLLMLGILGEYVGRIYDESKGRPLYIVQEFYSGRPQQSAQEQRVASLNK
ncbi:glycosyltransferase family 2 protein [Paenibacillus sp. FSL P4-0338]|uniref:glycosyltransferase family 2 protein n=1 Tax=unclassified Paenibacillus TaxID=185978 RepID=UPI0003E1C0D4|nr:glycosyltransferase family 2 protein [Paenibacillus sp. FSL R7-269]ETT39015.1 glycosyl transferase family protein [Paenibacillus sp. FSL R7-269]